MPKLLFRRILPSPERVAKIPGIKYLGPHILDPRLWYVNRRSVSAAVFWGLLCGFLPLPLHTLIAAFAAILFEINLPFCILMVWVSNPLTIPPILVGAYWLGSHILNVPMLDGHQILKLFKYLINWIIGTNGHPHFKNQFGELVWPLLLGLFIEAILVSSISALAVRFGWRYYIIFKWYQRKNRPHDQCKL